MILCRLCLYESHQPNEFINIFEKEIFKHIQNSLTLKIQEDDSLPKTACIQCESKIQDWVTFKSICHSSDNYLRQLKSNKVTTQLHDESLQFSQNNKTDNEEKIKSDEVIEEILVKIENVTDNESVEEIGCNLKETTNDYVCDICSKTKNSLFEFLEHQRTHEGKLVFKCDRCSEVFETKNALVAHDKSHKISCTICSKLMLPKSLKLHMIIHTDKYKCPECSMRFNNRSTMKTHIIARHTTLKEQVCEFCGKSFSTQKSLKLHIPLHRDTRDYHCEQCSFAGRTANALNIHMSKHENTERVCDICAKTFNSKRYLRSHMRRCHSAERKYECEHCKKKFVEKYCLKTHLQVHLDNRSFKCNVCERKFLRADGLKQHMSTHSVRKIYNCDKCGKHFIYERSIRRHACNSS